MTLKQEILDAISTGVIALDDPVSLHLEEFADIMVAVAGDLATQRTPSRAPTVRDLLRHTTGLTYRTGAAVDPVAALCFE